MAAKLIERAKRLSPATYIVGLAMLAIVFYVGIRIGGINVPLQRVPWSVLVPACTLFSLVHSTIMLGHKRALVLFGLCFAISLAAETFGQSTGLLFGPYYYTDILGPKVFGRVPLLIPLAWYMMFYPSYVVANVLAESSLVSRNAGPAWIVCMALVSAVLMTAWDLTMDPVMSFNVCGPHLQLCPVLDQAKMGHPAWVWIDGGPHFGVPLRNFAGWMITAFVVFLIYRFAETRMPHIPVRGHTSPLVAFLPIGVYGTMALVDTWIGYPQIEDVHLISPFAMGIPYIFATIRFVSERTYQDPRPAARVGKR